jgi:hypothetical protein
VGECRDSYKAQALFLPVKTVFAAWPDRADDDKSENEARQFFRINYGGEQYGPAASAISKWHGKLHVLWGDAPGAHYGRVSGNTAGTGWPLRCQTRRC